MSADSEGGRLITDDRNSNRTPTQSQSEDKTEANALLLQDLTHAHTCIDSQRSDSGFCSVPVIISPRNEREESISSFIYLHYKLLHSFNQWCNYADSFTQVLNLK